MANETATVMARIVAILDREPELKDEPGVLAERAGCTRNYANVCIQAWRERQELAGRMAWVLERLDIDRGCKACRVQEICRQLIDLNLLSLCDNISKDEWEAFQRHGTLEVLLEARQRAVEILETPPPPPRPPERPAPYQNKEWLEQKYVREELSCEQIAALAGCSHVTIQRWMRRYGIEMRSHEEAVRLAYGQRPADSSRLPKPTEPGPPYRDPEWLRRMYVDEGLSYDQIADIAGCAQATVMKWARRHGIKSRSTSRALMRRYRREVQAAARAG
jgi:hypothetical protein